MHFIIIIHRLIIIYNLEKTRKREIYRKKKKVIKLYKNNNAFNPHLALIYEHFK